MKPFKFQEKPLLGISACLLGELVRYNGGHSKDHWIANELAKIVDFHTLCPEMSMGLGNPRETLALVQEEKDQIRLQSSNQQRDLTELAQLTSHVLLKQLDFLSGFILMKKSPTCGLEKVKIYKKGTRSSHAEGIGIFAKMLKEKYPLLPIIESGRLSDPIQRENFLKQVMAYWRFQKEVKNIASLQKFHQVYKYILMEHNPKGLKELGALAANSNSESFLAVYEKYRELFFSILSQLPSVKKRKNVLFHVYAYFKRDLEREEKHQLLSLIEDYSKGLIPYLVPLKLLEHFGHKYNKSYLKEQYYFAPYPKELSLGKAL